MVKVVGSNQELCVGCNRCTRECPIEMANLTYRDENGDIKVKVDNTKCIACGACISVCKHEARYYHDDTAAFFADLDKGIPVSLIVAPSIRTNLPQYKRFFTWLKHLGVKKIYDASLGADICIWAHLRYIEKCAPQSLITQPCAAIVSYCEIHRHELLKNLSPVHSPMACTAVYMKQYEGIDDQLAALSPCIAKANEFAAIGTVAYNVTFAKLWEYIGKNRLKLPKEETDFDHYESALGSMFPMPGGLKENIEFFTGKSLRVDQSEGRKVYRDLDDFTTASPEMRPAVFDVLNCEDGCNVGSGCIHSKNIFEIQTTMNASRKKAMSKYDHAYYENLYKTYDAIFDLSSFWREYSPVETVSPEISEEEIQKAFRLLDKDTYAKQNFNCGACGSDTCRDMARKIALNINIPLNCLVKSRDDLRLEHKKNIDLYRRNVNYIGLVHSIGEYLLSAKEDKHSDVVLNALKDLCGTLDVNSVHIWKNSYYDGGEVYSKELFSWPAEDKKRKQMEDVIYEEWLPDWFEAMAKGIPLNKIRSSLSEKEKSVFSGKSLGSVVVAPVMDKGIFWGFIAVHSEEERLFDEEELAVTLATGILIVLSIVEKEIAKSKKEADQLVKVWEAASLTDPLTGIFNRRYLTSSVDEEMRNSYDNGRPLTLCMIDIDYFKRINDTYGHVFGDEVLVQLAKIVSKHLDENDIFGRYGGEEFLIIFRNSTIESALVKINGFMDEIRNTAWKHGTPVTISCGVSSYVKGIYFSNFIESADRNLYKAKENGRDQVVYQPCGEVVKRI